jgi:hypothetical protein
LKDKQSYLNKCVIVRVHTGYCDEDFEQGAKWQQQNYGGKSAEQLNLLYSMKNSQQIHLRIKMTASQKKNG